MSLSLKYRSIVNSYHSTNLFSTLTHIKYIRSKYQNSKNTSNDPISTHNMCVVLAIF